MNSTVASFGSAYPLNIEIQNQYQGEYLPVIYIVDENSSKALQDITIKVSRSKSNQIQFNGFNFPSPSGSVAPISGLIPSLAPTNATYTPGPDSYNLAVAFRPGVLKQSLVPEFSSILETAVASAISGLCSVYGPVTRNSDGAQIWYCAFQNTYDMLSDLNIELHGVSAEPGVGSRSSQVEVYFGDVVVNGSSKEIGFSRSAHVDILNHQGHSFAPLYFGVNGVNELEIPGTTPWPLSCYFETTNRKPIQFGPNTKFIFGFSYEDDNSSPLMHFNQKSLVDGIQWKGTDAVLPYNRSNTYEGNANHNFSGEYLAHEEGPYVPTDEEAPGTPASSHPENAEGYTYFSQTFHHNPSCDQDNPEHHSVKKLITNYKKQKTDNIAYYNKSTETTNLGEKYLQTTDISTDAFEGIDWNKQVVGQDFFARPEVLKVAKKYLQQIFNNGGKWMGSQRLLSAYLGNGGGLQALFNSTRTLNYKEKFNGATWLSKTNGFLGSSLDLGTQYPYGTHTYFYLSFYFGNSTQPSLANYPNSQSYFSNPWGYVEGSGSSAQCVVNSAIWNNGNFVDFITQNFEALIENLAALSSSYGDFFQGTENLIVPSQTLYNYLMAMYVAYKNYLESEFISLTLIDITRPITIDNWKTAYNNMLNFANNEQNEDAIAKDAGGTSGHLNSAYPWTDTAFLKYVNDNLTTLVDPLSINSYTPASTNSSPSQLNSTYGGSGFRLHFIVPSAALYNYFYESYQLSIYEPLLPHIPEKIKIYINPVSCIFNFEQVKVSGSGTVLLHVRTENIPGYWDTDFQIPIVKKSSGS